jgi:DNA-binding CsgD family transcriptional regulator
LTSPDQGETGEPGDIAILLGRFAPVVREGLKSLVSEDARAQLLAADLDVTDLRSALLPVATGVAIVSDAVDYSYLQSTSMKQLVGVIVFAERPCRHCESALADSGIAYLDQHASPSAIRAAIHHAARRDPRRVDRPARNPPRLTRRETQVLMYLIRDAAYLEIALDLTITVETVRTHTKNICRKVGCKNRSGLVGRWQLIGDEPG